MTTSVTVGVVLSGELGPVQATGFAAGEWTSQSGSGSGGGHLLGQEITLGDLPL